MREPFAAKRKLRGAVQQVLETEDAWRWAAVHWVAAKKMAEWMERMSPERVPSAKTLQEGLAQPTLQRIPEQEVRGGRREHEN